MSKQFLELRKPDVAAVNAVQCAATLSSLACPL